MIHYFLRRLVQTAIVVMLVSMIVFAISRLSGSPVDLMLPLQAGAQERADLAHELGLDQPLVVQYWRFVTSAVRGDFGWSTSFQAPALQLVAQALPQTIQLAVSAIVVGIIVGIPLGVSAGMKHDSWYDRVVTSILTLGQATPAFWLGILLILIFGVQLRVLPFIGNDGPSSLVLPVLALSVIPVVNIARMTRSSVISVLNQDFVRTAYGKGIRRFGVIRRHILRNGLIPIITIIGIIFGESLSGAVITEQVFAWPGIGSLAIQAIENRDYAVIQAVTMITSLFVVGLNLLVDLSYFLIDPRIRVARATTARTP